MIDEKHCRCGHTQSRHKFLEQLGACKTCPCHQYEDRHPIETCTAIKKDNTQCKAYGKFHCEDCGQLFCKHHLGRQHGRQPCPDTIPGTHSIWKEK